MYSSEYYFQATYHINAINRVNVFYKLLKDIHGNLLTSVSGLENLKSLRTLNLAGNRITHVGIGFKTLFSERNTNLRLGLKLRV